MNTPSLQDSRWVGRVLRDKWQIDGRIARGGMGTVFAATHRNNGSRAAIKILHPEFSRDKDTRSRFLQEGYAANKVGHPGVVRIIDDDVTEDGLAYLVMELLEGELLEQRRIRKGGRLPLTEVYEFADQLLDVLASAHAMDIVHRDIKPDNIFLTKQGKLKVLDFGFAQMKTSFRPEETATGFLLGTPGFMAPEQAIGNRPHIDARTDIWAVGATLFMLLTGEPVHPGESAAEVLVAAANFAVRSITTLDPGLPTKLAHAVDRALEFDRDARWPDARSMQEALRAVPGRQAPKNPIRRSIPDDERRPVYEQPVPLDDETLNDLVEDLGDDEDSLSASSETHKTYPHPSDRDGPTTAYSHPADRDGPTPELRRAPIRILPSVPYSHEGRLFAGPSAPSTDAMPVPPSTLRVGQFPPSDENVGGDETLVMDSRPLSKLGFGLASSGRQVSRPSYGDFVPPRPSFPPQNEILTSAGIEGPGSFGQAPVVAETPVARGPARILVFVALAGVTMLIVIITGLFVILNSD